MKRETAFVNRLRESLHAAGAVTFKTHGDPYTRAGWPDLWVGHWRFSGWIEAKAGDGTLTPLQVATLRKLQRAGVPAFLLHEDEARRLDGDGLLDLFIRKAASVMPWD